MTAAATPVYDAPFTPPAPGRVETPANAAKPTSKKHPVLETKYSIHRKRGADDNAPRTMRVDYKIGFLTHVSEWLCFEHQGFAQHKASEWWKRRSFEDVPNCVEEAVLLSERGRIARTQAITVQASAGDERPRIIAYELGDIPPLLDDHSWPAEAFDFPFGFNATPPDEEIPW